MRMYRRYLSLILLLMGTLAMAQTLPSNTTLDDTRARLRALPVTAHHSPERRQLLAVIQAAADELEPATFNTYMNEADPAKAKAMADNGILYYLETSAAAALAEIRATKVTRGVVIWHLYNMGYVVKTPGECFGIDICLRDGERLVPELDFLLVTHEHRDHYTAPLLDAMLAAKKPVVTRWYPGSTVITRATVLQFDTARVKIDIGDHHMEQQGQTDNMLMYQVTCGDPAAPFTLYHSGDGNNAAKILPNRAIDLFIYHVSVGLDARAAVARLQPHTIFPAHLLELAHSPKPPQAWRWPFTYAFNAAKSLAPTEAFVLSWGERWLAPGTEIVATAQK